VEVQVTLLIPALAALIGLGLGVATARVGLSAVLALTFGRDRR
jgi:hypothetical protein